MAPTPQPMTFQGSFALAPDQSLPQDAIPFNYTGTFLALSAEVANIVGAGSVAVPFGTIASPGAKGLLVRYDAAQPVGAAPVTLTINGGSQPLELTPGSMLVYFNASPSSGITSASFTVTAACQLRVWVLG
jgi:hypothetical protein